eukprot:1139827-Pelagomonas_calceolata.AAC.1
MDNDARESKLFQLSTWGPLRKCLSTRALVQEQSTNSFSGFYELHCFSFGNGGSSTATGGKGIKGRKRHKRNGEERRGEERRGKERKGPHSCACLPGQLN